MPALTGEMLCLADRGFLGFDLFQQASATGAALVWRAKVSQGLPVLGQYDDGSYRSELRWNSHCQSADRTPIPVRVVVYTLRGSTDATVVYRLVTNILDPARAPAAELAQLYHERWEIETAFDEFKTHLRGGQRVLRSKTPDLVEQEAWGFLLAHFALRALMHDAALGALPRARDPDTLSFVHVVRVTRRTLSHLAAISPSGLSALASGPPARAPRGDGELQPRSPRQKINSLPQLKEYSGFTPQVSIGVNSGEMVSGNIGSATLRRLDYTVIGDVVNTAQRLQSVAAPGQIIINKTAFDKIKESFSCTKVSEIMLKHKAEPVEIYNVMS